MELQQLKYFKVVANIGKISEAAEALFISAPALSTSISRLEKELDTKLFDRTGNRIILNQQGQIFLKYTNQVFSSLDSAKHELQQSMLHQGPHISVVSVNSVMWTNLITDFISEYPKYTLSCSSVSLPQLTEGGLSSHYNFLLAFEGDIPPSYREELDCNFLFESKPTVLIHKDHPLAKEAQIELQMLTNDRMFMPSAGLPLRTRLMQLFELYDIPFPMENSYSYTVRRKMVSENLGISFLTTYAGHVPPANVRCIPLVDPFDPWKACLFRRKEHAETEHEAVFRAFVEKFYHDLH